MNDDDISTSCPSCGEPLSDFSECACVFDRPARPVAAGKFRTGMREMVTRKLARQKAEREKKS
jgi:hypothetical protein